jgi:hypothetical protein
VVGLIERLIKSARRNLDRRVTGSEGVAVASYPTLADHRDLLVNARIGNQHHGTLALHARPHGDGAKDREVSADDALECNLGAGAPYHGTELCIEAQVQAVAAADLAVLAVELRQPDGQAEPGPESYSVEGRFDANGSAHLTLRIQLG